IAEGFCLSAHLVLLTGMEGQAPCLPVAGQGTIVTHNQTPSDRTRSAILSYVSQTELHRAHNFAATARPIEKLDLATTPTPWSQESPQSVEVFFPETTSELAPPLVPAKGAAHRDQAPPLSQSSADAIAPATVVETDFDIEARIDDDDPPFQAPESWLKPQNAQPNQSILSFGKNWNWSERSTAGFLGFAAGMLIVVPFVLFLSLTTNQNPVSSPSTDANTASASLPAAKEAVMAHANISAGIWFDTRATTVPGVDRRSRPAMEVISQAHQALTEGRIDQARIILRAAASPDTPRLWFMLAETYDPTVSLQLAQNRATTGRLQVADMNFARFYYQQALTHGIAEAQARLDVLTKQ
ncbi:MAG: hypothetical protein AAF385_17390, partial [Pseudomonadota bacterium]